MFEKQIAAGMQWLDETVPGWLWKIDLDKLNLKSACNCILGQQFGDYDYCPMAATIGVAYDSYLHWWKWSDDHGFSLDPDKTGAMAIVTAWNRLTDEWKTAILERRNEERQQEVTAREEGPVPVHQFHPSELVCLR